MTGGANGCQIGVRPKHSTSVSLDGDTVARSRNSLMGDWVRFSSATIRRVRTVTPPREIAQLCAASRSNSVPMLKQSGRRFAATRAATHPVRSAPCSTS